MAVVGEVASIAGLVSLAGQAIQAASSLYRTIKAYKNIPVKMQEVASTLQALNSCLSYVLRTALHANTVHGSYHPEVAEIISCVRSCYDLFNRIRGQLDAVMASGSGNAGKKLKIATENGYFDSIYQQLSAHHERLLILLDTATWYTNLETLAGVGELNIAATEIRDTQFQFAQQIRCQVTSMNSSLDRYMSQRAASEALLEQKIDALLRATSSEATQNQLATIEARLTSWQDKFQRSINAAQPNYPAPRSLPEVQASVAYESKTPEPLSSSTLPTSKENAEFLVDIVDTALVLRVQKGQLTYSLERVEEEAFTALSTPQKKVMVQYLQRLRLMLWLLRKQNYMTIASRKIPQSLPSPLAREASVHSKSVFCSSYDALERALRDCSLRLASVLPWLRWKPWLQYLFDRVEDRVEDGEQIMNMIVQQWERIPPPYDGDTVYYITVPRKGSSLSRSTYSCGEFGRWRRNKRKCCRCGVVFELSHEDLCDYCHQKDEPPLPILASDVFVTSYS